MVFLQQTVGQWCERCFGVERANNKRERALRVLEEAVELAQAEGVTYEQAERQVRVTMSRPVGSAAQEVGGVGVTLLAYCCAAGLGAQIRIEQEVLRILAIAPEKFAARNQEKIDQGLAE